MTILESDLTSLEIDAIYAAQLKGETYSGSKIIDALKLTILHENFKRQLYQEAFAEPDQDI